MNTTLSSTDLDDLFHGLGLDGGPAPAEALPSPAGPPEAAVRPQPEQPQPQPQLPSIGRQKTFIVENAGILNEGAEVAILSIVMMEIGPSVVMETGRAREVDIDLDAVEEVNGEVLGHIYNIVRARLEALNQPARPGGPDQVGGNHH